MSALELLRQLEPQHLLRHPFYQAWMEGTLPKEKLQDYAIQYFPHVNSFPRFVSAVHSMCEDDEVRPMLAHNLADEEGITGGKPHPQLWMKFAEGMGVSQDAVRSTPTKAASQALVDGFTNYSRSSYAEGLGALIAYEHQVPEIAKTKIDGLKKNYGIEDAETLEFFQVHCEADVYHTDACKKAFDRLSPADQEKATTAAKGASQLLWNFLTEAYA